MKSYLRTTMSNNHLNHLMTCTVHKELVKELNLKQVTNDFVDRVERRSSIVGHSSVHSSNRCGLMPLTLFVLVISDQNCYIFSIEL